MDVVSYCSANFYLKTSCKVHVMICDMNRIAYSSISIYPNLKILRSIIVSGDFFVLLASFTV